MLLHSKCVDDDPIIMSLTIALALFEVQWHPKTIFGFGCLIAFCSYLSHCLHHAQLAAAKYVARTLLDSVTSTEASSASAASWYGE